MRRSIIPVAANDDNQRTFREWAEALRTAAASPEIDPRLAQKARDIARSLDALAAAFRAALKG